MAEQKSQDNSLPDLSALALGSLLSQADSKAPHRERTREERRAGIADLVQAMEQVLEEDETE